MTEYPQFYRTTFGRYGMRVFRTRDTRNFVVFGWGSQAYADDVERGTDTTTVNSVHEISKSVRRELMCRAYFAIKNQDDLLKATRIMQAIHLLEQSLEQSVEE